MRTRFGRGALRMAFLVTGLTTLTLAGCATRSPTPADGAGDPRTLVIEDLVSAYAQIEAPMNTTLQIEATRADAQPELVDELLGQGFGLQRVTSDEGARLVDWSWQAQSTGPDPDSPAVARLSIGAHTLERHYVTTPDGTRPASVMRIGGTRAPVKLDDSRFTNVPDRVTAVRYSASDSATGIDMPLISLVTEDVVAGVARRATGRSPGQTGAPSTRGVNSSRIEVNNRYFSDSAFGGLRASMTEVSSETIVFPNDSMRLGEDGKRQIAAFIDAYRENTDMIGLVGCSNGPTALAIGNEGLALGRSKRVSDELLALGVDRARIIDEGCWSGDTKGSRFPGRGVVIELLRRKI